MAALAPTCCVCFTFALLAPGGVAVKVVSADAKKVDHRVTVSSVHIVGRQCKVRGRQNVVLVTYGHVRFFGLAMVP